MTQISPFLIREQKKSLPNPVPSSDSFMVEADGPGVGSEAVETPNRKGQQGQAGKQATKK